MDEILWAMMQESRVLHELRKDIHGVWQDEAARELTSRFFDPHESEDQQMLAALQQQVAAMEQSRSNLSSAESYGREVEQLAVLVTDGLKATGQEMKNAYGSYDTYMHYHSEARSKFPDVENLLTQANQVGNT